MVLAADDAYMDEKALHDYALKFGFSNAVLAGDAGKNGLDRA